MVVGFTACRQMLPDPARYTECIVQSYEALAAAAGAPAGEGGDGEPAATSG